MHGIRNLIVRRRPSGLDYETDHADAGVADIPDGEGYASAEATPAVERPRVTVPKAPSYPQSTSEMEDERADREDPVPASKPVRIASRPATPLVLSPDQRRITTGAAKGRKIWDMEPPTTVATHTDQAPTSKRNPSIEPGHLAGAPISKPVPSRAKTRLLGFHGDAPVHDILATETAEKDPAGRFPIGWIVVIDGPGRGASFTLEEGLSTIGRDPDQTVALDYGDASISRTQHVAIAYDSEENCAFIGHGGKQNIVRHNGKPLLTTEPLTDRDTIKVGKTTLQFVAFCGAQFSWGTSEDRADG